MKRITDYNAFFSELFLNLLLLIGGTSLIAWAIGWQFALGLAFLFMYLKKGM